MSESTSESTSEGVAFTGKDGKSWTLPLISSCRGNLPGRELRNASMNGEAGMITYMFKLLEVSGADPDAIEALYDLPQDEMLDVMQDWSNYAGDLGK